MGQLLYDAGAQSFDIEDRALAHLRVILMNKLRRGEPFLLHLPDPQNMGTRSVWIHPAISLVLSFYGSRSPSLNREWLDTLMSDANGPNGLTLGAEPLS